MHTILPDMPPAIVAALSEYDWNQVDADKISTMIERMRSQIGGLPAKPSHWAWTGALPTFKLSPDVPQAAFNVLNTRDWGRVPAETVQSIISGARMYFIIMGVPKKQATAAFA